MMWHLARAFTAQELRARSDRQAQVILQYSPDRGYYEFRIAAASKEGLIDVARFVGDQVDRMIEELERDGS